MSDTDLDYIIEAFIDVPERADLVSLLWEKRIKGELEYSVVISKDYEEAHNAYVEEIRDTLVPELMKENGYYKLLEAAGGPKAEGLTAKAVMRSIFDRFPLMNVDYHLPQEFDMLAKRVEAELPYDLFEVRLDGKSSRNKAGELVYTWALKLKDKHIWETAYNRVILPKRSKLGRLLYE